MRIDQLDRIVPTDAPLIAPRKKCGACGETWDYDTPGYMLADAVVRAVTFPRGFRFGSEYLAVLDSCIACSDPATHTEDLDCAVDRMTDECIVCGALHGDPCPECDGRAFHRPGCTLSDATIEAEIDLRAERRAEDWREDV